MIVPMKKVSIVTVSSHTIDTLKVLRGIGVIHVEKAIGESADIAPLYEKKKLIDRAANILLAQKVKKKSKLQKDQQAQDAMEIVRKVTRNADAIAKLYEEIGELIKVKDRIGDWGSFDPLDVALLKEKGILLRLFELQKKDEKKIPEHVPYLVLDRMKNVVRIAVIGEATGFGPEWNEFVYPEKSLQHIVFQIRDSRARIDELQKEIVSHTNSMPLVKTLGQEMEKILEFEEVRASMGKSDPIEYVTGFVPENTVDMLKKTATREGWGLLIQDPGPDDRVPTLLKNSKPISIIQPVFDLFEIRPGYREYDISFWFLLFFSIFFAMLIGDGGYGAIIILLTLIARLKFRKAPGAPFVLLFLLGLCTVIWGALTGTWFGLEMLARNPILSRAIIPQLAAFPEPGSTINTGEIMMDVCFTIAVIHLSIAHIVNLKRLFLSLKMISELGKLSVLWGMYFLVENILLNKPSYGFTIWLIFGGFGLILIFSEQEGKFFAGILKSVSGILPMALGIISVFADIVSYFRLFAVGLAGVEIAKSFTQIAFSIGFGSVISGIGAAVILVAVHALNLVLGGLSVIVHGARLNLLEFSGHLGLEWSGFAYKPFKED